MALQRASFSQFVLLILLPSVPSEGAQPQDLIHHHAYFSHWCSKQVLTKRHTAMSSLKQGQVII